MFSGTIQQTNFFNFQRNNTQSLKALFFYFQACKDRQLAKECGPDIGPNLGVRARAFFCFHFSIMQLQPAVSLHTFRNASLPRRTLGCRRQRWRNFRMLQHLRRLKAAQFLRSKCSHLVCLWSLFFLLCLFSPPSRPLSRLCLLHAGSYVFFCLTPYSLTAHFGHTQPD